MAFQSYLVLGLLVVLGLFTNVIAVRYPASLNRTSFPEGFIFGTAAAAYQYEGAAKEDGKGPSIWDTYTHEHPDWIKDGNNADVAVDQYHLYKDVEWRDNDDFRDYAELLFKEFGDRVKHWITLNEPWSFSNGGYAEKSLAPGRCSTWQNLNCTGGDSGTEPYLVTHHELLSHAAAVEVYKKKYQATQKGVIGITLISHWFVPFSNAERDQRAAQRGLDFMLGWFLDPLTNGDYPHSMRSLVKDRLPKFTKEESKQLNGSFDFIGLNYYTAKYAAHAPQPNGDRASYLTDASANLITSRNGILIGPPAASSWLYVYPRGFRDLLLYVKKKYHNPLIYITENGYDEFNNATLSLKEALADSIRIEYHDKHFVYLHRAIKEGVNVKGYFAWSLLDNFEWSSGFSVRFGINFVDYKNGNKRYPKHSARWFKNFLKK
ncbi:hypothetical protein SO802_019483 [Lithocarpus litseifolius]|uniref:Beta-glucosidase n=1 Tax=Lithocarpus litseifolius TaxID=425828 RepID=A0AAW2CS82_9ROSI